MRLLGRSYMAFVLAPEPPCIDWLGRIDEWLRGSPEFFARKAVVLDLGGVTLSNHAIAHLVSELQERGVRVMGLENADPTELGPNLPPVLFGGRANGAEVEAPETPGRGKPAAGAAAGKHPTLLLDSPVRSGQSILHPEGDVTVLGSVSSGAELVAGGSIHIYGTLRGRAMAGSNGNPRARIFCSRIQAELLAINGYYLTADAMDPALSDRPVQAWLEGETIMMANLE
jgi:septum site-determining protein MinC